MTQQSALRDMDAQIFAAIDGAGLTDRATLVRKSGAEVACGVYVDRNVEVTRGESGVSFNNVTVTAFLHEIVRKPEYGDTFVIGDERLLVESVLNADDSRVVCLMLETN